MNPVPHSAIKQAETRPKPMSFAEFSASRPFVKGSDQMQKDYDVYLEFFRLDAWNAKNIKSRQYI